jgi:molecular chaperone GrpE (heat shock protein)
MDETDDLNSEESDCQMGDSAGQQGPPARSVRATGDWVRSDSDGCGHSGGSGDGKGVRARLDGISGQLEALRDEFSSKIKRDAFKDKLIDSLHRELQSYKNDLVKKHVQSMVVDVIKIIDDIRRLSDHYRAMAPEELEPAKLLRILRRIPDDLEDIFYYQGVKPFTCDGPDYDPSRQRLLKRVETADSLLDKTVAESLRPGYEWDGKMIRPELVAVYVYRKPSVEENIGNSDE